MNIIRTIVFLALVLCIPNYVYAQDIVLYGTAADSCNKFEMGSGESSLYLLNPNTGQTKLIGPTGFEGVSALAFLGDGRLVATARQGKDSAILIEINPFSGQGSLIGVIGNSNNPGECGRVPGLTYDSATDMLFGIGLNCGGSLVRVLATIDPDTAVLTPIGEVGYTGGGNGLAVRSDGTLYAAALSGDDLSFYTLNRNTGAATLVGTVNANIPPAQRLNVNGLDFHPVTGQLFGSSTEAEDDIQTSYLVTIDESLPNVNIIGQALDCFDGIVFGPAQQINVPTLSEWGLIAMASILGIIGFMVIRKRKVTA